MRQPFSALGNDQVQIARQLINILPTAKIVQIFQYLVEVHMRRRSGWPDLLAYRENEILFAEAQVAGSKLGKNKERWIRDNYERLHFPFKLVNVLKSENYRIAA
jgi:hypothetical protein